MNEYKFGDHLGFIKRIINWNDARYEPILNVALTNELLKEEIQEFHEATSEVETLDALVDIVYVAVGAMHKMGLDEFGIYQALHAVCNANDTKSASKTKPHVKANVDKGISFIPPESRLQEILNERI